jgi:hypothetical protein
MISRARTRAAVALELAHCEARRDELDRLIARLRRVQHWLDRRPAAVAGRSGRRPEHGAPPAAAESLTHACRAVLRGAAPRALTPIGVRDALAAIAFPFGRFVNPMAAVHTVLKRLVQQREAHTGIDEYGDRRYAARQVAMIGLDRDALADEAFLQKLLAAESPDLALKLIERRRRAER